MGDAPYTGDLDLAAVCTRDELAAVLRVIHIRADRPSLRTLEARTRHSETPLSKTAVAEMLKGARFPRKAVMIAFLRACGIPEDVMEPCRRAWERVAAGAEALAQPEAGAVASSRQTERAAAAGDPPRSETLLPSWDGTQSQNVPEDQPTAVKATEIGDLREQVRQLMADNENLRLQLANKTGNSSLQISVGRDSAAEVYMESQDHVVRYFSIDDGRSEQLFYSELEKQIQNAKEAIYILSRGFHNERRSSVYRPLIRADRDALRHGVDMIRIQTGNPVAASWARGYARLLREFPNSFRIVADLDGISYNDVVLIDPRGHDPVVILLFETSEPGPLGPVGRPIFAFFVINARVLARNLADQLVKHADDLAKLNSQIVSDLASSYIYFAWGVHMARRKIQSDVPDARPLGKAILHEWRRDIKGMLSGPADRATIQHTGNKRDAFDGVAYELSWWGKARIDRLERRAYEEVPVTIELEGKARPAFTYVPLPAATEKDHLARGSWIDLVVAGALENDMTGLLSELRAGGAPVDENRL